ncbi:hypothetical protein D3C80_1363900 [compost metagenome]|jgi:hypothetical protein
MMFTQAYFAADAPQKAEAVANKLIKFATDFSNYYLDLPESKQVVVTGNAFRNIEVVHNLIGMAQQAKQDGMAKKWNSQVEALTKRLQESEPFRQQMQQMMQQQMMQQQQGAPQQ